MACSPRFPSRAPPTNCPRLVFKFPSPPPRFLPRIGVNGNDSTQTTVEKWLRKHEGVTRRDLGRERFLERVLEWQDRHGGIIIEQLKRLGCSADWSRQRYTLDDGYVRAVQQVFVELYR